MNSVPNSPQELLNMNQEMEELSWEDKMMREVCNHEPSETLPLLMRMLKVLLKFHVKGVSHYHEEGDTENMMLWLKDTTTIDNVITLMKDINL